MLNQEERTAREVGVRIKDADITDELVVHHLVVWKGESQSCHEADGNLEEANDVHCKN